MQKKTNDAHHGHAHGEQLSPLLAHMPGEQQTRELSRLFAVLGDQTRVRMLCALMQSELYVCQLAELLSMEQSAVSHQLRVLRDGGAVRARRQGKQMYYSLADGHIKALFEQGYLHATEKGGVQADHDHADKSE